MAYGEKMQRLSPCSDELVCGYLAAFISDPKRILDVGCGRGERMKALSATFPQAKLFGVDADADMVKAASSVAEVFHASAEELPFENESFPLALCECSLSLFTDAEKALAEMARVLENGGFLLVGELFASLDGKDYVSAPDGEAIGKIYSGSMIEAMAKSAGFEMLSFSDRGEDLAAMAAQMLFDGSLCRCIGTETALLLRKIKVRYGLWIFKKG